MEELTIIDPVTNDTRVYVVITRDDGSKVTIEKTDANTEYVALTTEPKEEANG